MCGIILGRDLTGHAVNHLVWGQFEKQISRGTEGFGAFNGEHIFKTPKLKKMRGWIRNSKNKSDFLMFHHRWPTSTINVRRAAHPFSTRDYFGDTRYVLVHNGHISNSRAMKLEHEKLGIEYTSVLDDGTFNDSEALLWDFALMMEGKKDSLETYGGIAFVAAKLVNNEITHLYFGRNSNPLHLYREKQGFMVSSEGPGENIDPHTLYTYNYKLNRLTTKHLIVPSYSASYGAHGTPAVTRTYDPYWDEVEGEDFFINEDGRVEYIEDMFEDLPIPLDGDPNKGRLELEAEKITQRYWLATLPRDANFDIQMYKVFGRYMVDSYGIYDDAYQDMCDDYEDFAKHNKTPERELILKLLMSAMRHTIDHPGYEDMNSVNNYYQEKGVDEYKARQAQLALGAGKDE